MEPERDGRGTGQTGPSGEPGPKVTERHMTSSGPLRAGRSPIWAVGSVALAVSLIGTIGTAAELGPDSLSATTVGAWRAVIGAAGMVAITLIRRQAPWRYPLPPRWVALGALGLAASQLGFFEAVARTGVAVGTLVVIGVGPVAAGIIDWLAHRHRPGGSWVAGVALAMGGMVLLTGGAGAVVWSGVAFGVMAGCGIPCQGFVVQHLLQDRPLMPAVTTVVGSGAVLLLPIALMSVQSAFASPASVTTVVYLGLVTITVAHTLWGAGLKYLRLSVAVVVGLLEPAVAAVLAMTVLDEAATFALVAGICLVIAGVAVTSFSRTGEVGH